MDGTNVVVGRFFAGVGVVVALLGAATGCGRDESSARDKDRFCRLAQERQARQPEIDFGQATPEEVKRAFSTFVEQNEANVEESLEVAPEEIADDFASTVEGTERIAETGDLSEFEKPEFRTVGEYLAEECGIEGP